MQWIPTSRMKVVLYSSINLHPTGWKFLMTASGELSKVIWHRVASVNQLSAVSQPQREEKRDVLLRCSFGCVYGEERPSPQ
jgi:hypothetical protein